MGQIERLAFRRLQDPSENEVEGADHDGIDGRLTLGVLPYLGDLGDLVGSVCIAELPFRSACLPM